MTRRTPVLLLVGLVVVVGCSLLLRLRRGDTSQHREPVAATVPQDPLGGAAAVDVTVPPQTTEAPRGQPVAVPATAPVRPTTPQPAVTVPPPLRAAPTEPPWIRDGVLNAISPSDGALRALSHSIAESAGGEVVGHALGMLNAEQENIPLLGVAILSDLPGWDEALVDAVGGHPDWAVPLYAIQALRDAGRNEEADAVLARFLERTPDWGALTQSTATRHLPGTVSRGVLALLAAQGDDEQRKAYAAQVASSPDADYSARMRALLDAREVVPFTEFRVQVATALSDSEENSVWRTGLERLSQRLEGPVQVHQGPPVLTVSDVDEMVAREYPAQYEDLALRIEMLTRTPEGRVGPGVVQRLLTAAQTARKTPLSAEETAALVRIESLAARLTEQDVRGLVPDPPPM